MSTEYVSTTVEEITRTVAETTVGPGESTTVTVDIELEESLELEPGEVVRIDEVFSPGFGEVTHLEGTPEPGGAGGGADGEEYLAVWNEGAEQYVVTYEVMVPPDALGGTEFDITGTVDLAGQVEALPDATITVGIPEETSVMLVPSTATVPSDGEATLELVVTGADQGIGSYSVSLASDSIDAAAFADIELTNAAESDNSEITDGGASALVDAVLSEDHAAEPAITIAELTLDTGEDGAATISMDSATVSDPDGQAYDIASTSGATLTVETGPPPLPGQANPPQDLDGDGLYEDVDGDGQFSIFDVQAFFNHFGSDEVQENAQFFNFNEDADESVSIFDVQALFNKLQAWDG